MNTEADKLSFIEGSHQYFYKGKELISCSTLVGEFSPEFDPDKTILNRCAQKRSITPEELQKEWDKERDDSCIRGTSLHKEAEYWVKTGKVKKDGQYPDVIKQLKKMKFNGKLQSERIVFSENLGIAGCIDLTVNLGQNRKEILDFKSNKKINFKNKFFISKIPH